MTDDGHEPLGQVYYSEPGPGGQGEPVNVLVSGWMEPWVQNLARAQCLVFEQSEMLSWPLDDAVLKSLVERKLDERIWRHIERHCQHEGLAVLGTHAYTFVVADRFVRRVQVVVMKKATMPPVQDWGRVFR